MMVYLYVGIAFLTNCDKMDETNHAQCRLDVGITLALNLILKT